MSPEPASVTSRSSFDHGRVIWLFLAKLLEYLVGLQTSGESVVPKDIEIMVRSADAMANSIIRSLAVRQLKSAGYTYAARALRDPDSLREARREAQAAGGADSLVCSCSRAPSVRIERAQGCAPVSPSDLLDRLTTTIEIFERADELAGQLARMVLCALAFVFPEVCEPLVFARPANDLCRVGFSPPTIIPVAQGPPYTWPPPLLDPGSPPGTAGGIRLSPSNSFPGASKRVRDPEKKLAQYAFAEITSDRVGADAPTPDLIRDGNSIEQFNLKNAAEPPSAATHAHLVFTCSCQPDSVIRRLGRRTLRPASQAVG